MRSRRHDLSLVVLPGKNPSPLFLPYYEKAFSLWREVWEEAAQELSDFPSKLYANDFLRQDEVLAVFLGDECTSLGFWTELDMSVSANQLDQYFQSWDPSSFSQLMKDGDWVGKYSYFTIAKKFRSWHRKGGVSLADLQVALFCLRFLDSDCASMTGTTRNNRKINEVCERGGAQVIKRGLFQHGCEIDLMAWYRSTAKPYVEVKDLARFLWMNRIDFKKKLTVVGGENVS